MSELWKKVRHAFSIEPDGAGRDLELPPSLEKVATSVVERGMETPAVIFLESIVPLSFLGSQAMFAAWPLVKMAPSAAVSYEEIASALENRATVRLLAARIEELAADRRVQ